MSERIARENPVQASICFLPYDFGIVRRIQESHFQFQRQHTYSFQHEAHHVNTRLYEQLTRRVVEYRVISKGRRLWIR